MVGRHEPTLQRIAAVAAPLGIATHFLATALHGGHHPGDLAASLPEYAANANWLAWG